MADNYDMRQPELRNWQPSTIREGLPALFGSLYANIPGVGLLDPNVERRGMDVGHRLTNALMQSPAGLGLMAHETGTKTGDHLGQGDWAKALGTLLGGGAAIAAPFGIGKTFGPGSRDANIAATLEAMAPGPSAISGPAAQLNSLMARESQLIRDNTRLQGLIDSHVPGRDYGAANINNRASMRPRLMPVND